METIKKQRRRVNSGKRKQIDPLERAIETALSPGSVISYNDAWSFVDDVRDLADNIGKIIKNEPERAARLYETFIAACHEKADEIDDSSGKTGLEKLAKYIIRACFSQERMVYVPVEKSTAGVAKVIYTSKNGRTRKTFDALDWLAQLVMHIPERYEQTVRYYGFYSKCSISSKITRDSSKKVSRVRANETPCFRWLILSFSASH